MLAPIEIVYEDAWLLAVHKPAAMPVHRSWGCDRHSRSVLDQMRRRVAGPVVPVHRLDRATSGLLLLARDPDTAARLAAQFRTRAVCKTYQAVVRGFCETSGDICKALARPQWLMRPPSSRTPRRVAEDLPDENQTAAEHPGDEHPGDAAAPDAAAPQPSHTRYVTLERYELPFRSDRYATSRLSLLEVQPLTGRWHQIRRHLNHIAHPILGDTSHGDNTQNRFFRQQFGLQRLLLAATALQFVHPQTGQSVQLTAAPDDSFADLVRQFRTWLVPGGPGATS